MTKLIQTLIDGLGIGSTYALFALGISLIFGVMHLVNFAHGELLTISAYTTYMLYNWGVGWWIAVPLLILAAVGGSVATEQLAFRWVRNSSPFTLLLTSFALERLSHAIWQIAVSPKARSWDKVSWAFNTVEIGSVRLEVMDLVTLGVTALVLVGTAFVFRRTLFGIAVRGAAEDFDAARLMGVKANRVITGAFAYAGLLAGIAAALILMRTPSATPNMGSDWLLKAVIAAVIGGLGSFSGAVIGGLALGVLEAGFRGYLPDLADGLDRFSSGFVFIVIALLFIVRPQGLFEVKSAERV